MKRRPGVLDRDLADVWFGLRPGNYRVSVEDTTKSIRYLGLAKLKVEGSTEIELEDKIILITPDN